MAASLVTAVMQRMPLAPLCFFHQTKSHSLFRVFYLSSKVIPSPATPIEKTCTWSGYAFPSLAQTPSIARALTRGIILTVSARRIDSWQSDSTAPKVQFASMVCWMCNQSAIFGRLNKLVDPHCFPRVFVFQCCLAAVLVWRIHFFANVIKITTLSHIVLCHFSSRKQSAIVSDDYSTGNLFLSMFLSVLLSELSK